MADGGSSGGSVASPASSWPTMVLASLKVVGVTPVLSMIHFPENDPVSRLMVFA
eukprot:COSAG02_NODE_560_length_20328_cov_15.507343_17_plen_54_part_00